MTFDSGKCMVVVKCGASGHNIRSRPSLKAPPVGMLALGNSITIQEYVRFARHDIYVSRMSVLIFLNSAARKQRRHMGTDRRRSCEQVLLQW